MNDHGLPVTEVEPTLPSVRREWQEQRTSLRGLGASDAATICGLNRFKSRLQLYLELTGEAPREATISDAVREAGDWGERLESTILREYAVMHHCFVLGRDEWYRPALFTPSGRVWHEDTHAYEERVGPEGRGWLSLQHEEHRWLFAHPDGFVLRKGVSDYMVPARILQVKTSSAYRSREWGEEHTDEIPEDYIVQEQVEIALLAQVEGMMIPATVAALIGGQKFREYDIEPNGDLQKTIIGHMVEFWRRVEAEEDPEPETGAERKMLAELRFPATTGEERVASTREHDLAKRLANVQVEIERLQDEEADLKGRLEESMEAVYKVVGDGWSATWGERKGNPSWKSIAEALAPDGVPPELIEANRGRKQRVLQPRVKGLWNGEDGR